MNQLKKIMILQEHMNQIRKVDRLIMNNTIIPDIHNNINHKLNQEQMQSNTNIINYSQQW